MPKKGNITGEPFDKEVVDQIEARQIFLGINPKQDKHLIYQNNKTAFLRLASSVKINGYSGATADEILELRGISKSYAGDKLAKASVLFGGVVSIDNNNSPQLNYGLKEVFNNDSPFNGAYGWGGITQQGYRPMPGIESANIDFYNRGALARADVKIKVFTVEQLQVFDLLYLKIGYSMLLEWGHNVYIDNKGNLQNRNTFTTEAFSKFFSEGATQNDVLDAIKLERKNSAYNYDAMLGKVTNFTWKFNTDGSYDIELKLVGYGDLIEALKINTTNPKGENKDTYTQQLNKKQNNLKKTREQLQAKLDKELKKPSMFGSIPSDPESLNTFNEKFTRLLDQWKKLKLQSSKYDQATIAFTLNIVANGGVTTSLQQSLVTTIKGFGSDEVLKDLNAYAQPFSDNQTPPWENYAKQINALVTSEQSISGAVTANQIAPQSARENKDKTTFNTQLYNWINALNKDKNTDPENLCTLSFKAKADDTAGSNKSTLGINQYYVRLGYMLDWMEKNLLVYDNTKPKDSNGNYPPLFKFDTDPENNFCKRFSYQIPSDPFVCLIPTKNTSSKLSFLGNNNNNKKGSKTESYGWSYFTSNTPGPDLSAYFVDGNDNLGKVMNIFVNIDFVAKTLEGGIDVNGKSNLVKFLSDLLNGVNDSLGNVNKLEAQYDSESNTIKIIEGSKLDVIQETGERMAVFESYGVKIGSKGSFLTNVDFQVQLPPNMAAMATISAQASGNIVGENATGLSKLNKGLVDRIVTTKLDASSVGLTTSGSKDDPEVFLQKKINQVNTFLKELYVNFSYNKKNVETLRSINRDVSLYTTGDDSEKEKASSPFFIPFNLSLEMDGLSGMRNYERFAITEQILPYSYRASEQRGVIDFLVKGISHTIANNQWKTKIESLTVSSKRSNSQPSITQPPKFSQDNELTQNLTSL